MARPVCIRSKHFVRNSELAQLRSAIVNSPIAQSIITKACDPRTLFDHPPNRELSSRSLKSPRNPRRPLHDTAEKKKNLPSQHPIQYLPSTHLSFLNYTLQPSNFALPDLKSPAEVRLLMSAFQYLYLDPHPGPKPSPCQSLSAQSPPSAQPSTHSPMPLDPAASSSLSSVHQTQHQPVAPTTSTSK